MVRCRASFVMHCRHFIPFVAGVHWQLWLEKLSYTDRKPKADEKTCKLKEAVSRYRKEKSASNSLLIRQAQRQQAWLASLQKIVPPESFQFLDLFNISPLIVDLGRPCIWENVGLATHRHS